MSEKNINTINNKYWHKTIWFKEHILHNAFISWLALRRRLPTKDRLRRWRLNVSGTCVLCNLEIETHRHLFFECFFSRLIWEPFAAEVWISPPYTLLQPESINLASTQMRMLLQSSSSTFSQPSTCCGKSVMLVCSQLSSHLHQSSLPLSTV